MSKKFKFNKASIVACAAMLIFFQGCSSLNPWGESDSDKEALMNRRSPPGNPMGGNTLQTKPTESTAVKRDFSEQNQAYQRYLANKPETLAEFDKKKRYPKLNVSELNKAMDNSAITGKKIEVTPTSNLKEVIDHNKKHKASAKPQKSSTHHKKKKSAAAKAKKEVCVVEAPTTTSAKSSTTIPVASTTPQTVGKDSTVKSVRNSVSKAPVNPTQEKTLATSANSQVNSNKSVNNSKQQINSASNNANSVTTSSVGQAIVSSNSSQNGSVSSSKNISMNKANTSQQVVVKNNSVQTGNVSNNQAVSGVSKTVMAVPSSNVGLNSGANGSINYSNDASTTKANAPQPGAGGTLQTGNTVNVQSNAGSNAKQSTVPVSSTIPSSTKPAINQDLDKMSQSDIEKYLKDKFKESPEAGFIDKLGDDSAPQTNTGAGNATAAPLAPATDNANNINTTSGVSRILRSGGYKKLDKVNSLLIECYYNVRNKVSSILSNED